jgi:hypothetical protein
VLCCVGGKRRDENASRLESESSALHDAKVATDNRASDRITTMQNALFRSIQLAALVALEPLKLIVQWPIGKGQAYYLSSSHAANCEPLFVEAFRTELAKNNISSCVKTA